MEAFVLFKYPLGLSLVKVTEKKISDRKKFIIEVITVFNEKSRTSVVNPKYIGLGINGDDDVMVNDSSIIITLYSQQALSSPGKAVRLLSQLLLQSNNENSFNDLVSDDGKLFKTFNVAKVADSDSGDICIVDSAQVEDSTFVKALIDYLLKSKSRYSSEINEQQNAIERMKVLAIESGIIKLQ